MLKNVHNLIKFVQKFEESHAALRFDNRNNLTPSHTAIITVAIRTQTINKQQLTTSSSGTKLLISLTAFHQLLLLLLLMMMTLMSQCLSVCLSVCLREAVSQQLTSERTMPAQTPRMELY